MEFCTWDVCITLAGAATRGSMLAAGIEETGLVGGAGRGGGVVGIAPAAGCGAETGAAGAGAALGAGAAGAGAAGAGAAAPLLAPAV